MAINLDKSIEAVKITLEKLDFKEKVDVVFALDVSASMTQMFRNGLVQELTERLLAIGINMDQNQKIDVYTFGSHSTHIGEVERQNIDGFVDAKVFSRGLQGSTRYAAVIKDIVKDYLGVAPTSGEPPKKGFLQRLFGGNTPVEAATNTHPVVVFFITDGDTFDAAETEKLIREHSNKPIFWQFVGIGNSHFSFLEKLDNMAGRTVDNANFFNAGDIRSINDNELYSRILAELPLWYKDAMEVGVIK